MSNDQDQDMMNKMIPGWFISKLSHHLQFVSRFNLPEDILEAVTKFVDHQIKFESKVMSLGEKYFRARIHGPTQDDVFPPDQMGAPTPAIASAGRINPAGIPYLYLSDSPDTAISEVRAWKGAAISVAEFVIGRDMTVVDLTPIPLYKPETERDKERQWMMIFYNLIKTLYFSSPVHSANDLAYLPSQYVSELFKVRGIDGLIYKSVMREGGENVVIFNPEDAAYLAVNKYIVDAVQYHSRRAGGAGAPQLGA